MPPKKIFAPAKVWGNEVYRRRIFSSDVEYVRGDIVKKLTEALEDVIIAYKNRGSPAGDGEDIYYRIAKKALPRIGELTCGHDKN